MKALSVRQPWASMIAQAWKTIETRTWATSYRGPLLIVSSKTPRIEPAGCALCICNLVDCRPMREGDAPAAQCSWAEGLFSWVLADIRRIEPFPVKGKLGLYEVDYQVEENDHGPRSASEIIEGVGGNIRNPLLQP